MPQRNAIEVVINAINNTAGVFDDVKNSAQSLGQGLADLGANLTALGAPFLGIATKAFTAFDDLGDQVAQLETVLKSTGGAVGLTREELLRMATAAQEASVYSRTLALGAENVLLTFTNIGKTTFPRALRATLDLSTAMKQDLKSSAIQLGKALNDPIAGITALTRVGVTFTEEQKKMIASMVEAGDVAGAQGIILDEIAREFGGSAAAQVDMMSRLGNELNDLWINIGVIITPIIEAIGNMVIPILHNISQALTAMAENGDDTVGFIIVFGAALAIAGPLLMALGAGLAAVVGLLSGPLLPILALVAGLVLLVQHFGITKDQILMYLSLVKLYAEYYIQGVITAISNIIDSIKKWVEAHPAIITAILLIGGFIFGLMLIVAGLNLAFGITVGLLGLLLSPVLILAAAIAALLFVIEEFYPGGLSGILKDAGTAAQQLGYILQYYLGKAVVWVRTKFYELQIMVLETFGSILDFISGLVNNPLLQALDQRLAAGAENFNKQYLMYKAAINLAKNNLQGQANVGFTPPPLPPALGGPAAASAAPTSNTTGLDQRINSILDLIQQQKQSPITVNFQGTGGPTTPSEAQDSAHMLVNSLRSSGVPVG